MPTYPPELFGTAAHEAGHATVAFHSPAANQALTSRTCHFDNQQLPLGIWFGNPLDVDGFAGPVFAVPNNTYWADPPQTGGFWSGSLVSDLRSAVAALRASWAAIGSHPRYLLGMRLGLHRSPKIDFARSLPGQPKPYIDALNIAYIEARQTIEANRAGYDRLLLELLQKQRVERKRGAEMLGKRSWFSDIWAKIKLGRTYER